MSYKPLKICVLNLSGNVGKTALSVHMLAAFRPTAKLISVETINNNDATDVEGLSFEEMKASAFRAIYREMMMSDDVIIDVGSSNVEIFMSELTKYRSSLGELDLIMVPTVPSDKQQKDTIATVEWLHSLGISPGKVRVVFNQHNGIDTISDAFAHVMGYAQTDGAKKATWAPYPVVSSNDCFELIKDMRQTIRALALDSTDWKAARVIAREAKDLPGVEKAMEGQMAADLAKAAFANLEQSYENLLAPLGIKAVKK